LIPIGSDTPAISTGSVETVIGGLCGRR
jgi:hypothetical protein